jgi:hypothetical protein
VLEGSGIKSNIDKAVAQVGKTNNIHIFREKIYIVFTEINNGAHDTYFCHIINFCYFERNGTYLKIRPLECFASSRGRGVVSSAGGITATGNDFHCAQVDKEEHYGPPSGRLCE